MSDSQRHASGDWWLYRRLLSYVVPYSAAFLFSVAGFLVYSLGSVLLADLTQFLLDSLGQSSQVELGLVSAAAHWFWPPGDKTALEYARVAVPVAAVVLSLGRALGFFVGNYYMNVVARSVVHTLRVELFEVMMAAPRRYYDANTGGNLLSKITFNVEQVSGAASDALKAILREGLTVMALVTYMLYLNWRLTLIFFAVAPAIGLVVVVVGRHFRRYSRRIQDSMGSVTQVSSESLGAFEALRVFAATRQQVAKFTDASLFNRNQSLKLAFVQAVSTPVIQTLLALALGALFWFALDPTILAGFTAGSLVAFITAAAQMGKPIRTLSGVQSIIQRGLAAAEDVFEQIDIAPEPDRGTTPVTRAKGEIVIERLSFRYPEANEYALENVSLQLKPGETVALVGRSGSGKSTLVQLLLRFYTPEHGEIRLDDLVVEEYALADYRRQFGVVSQDISLFSDTIANNIAFGEMGQASYDAVLSAAQQAHATAFIEAQPQGLDTVLGDGGAGLSGGQKQRLAIARALLKDAPILILDEATSALDTESETYIQEALAGFCKDRTTLIIAHRLSTIESADRVVVMDEGRIVAFGPHQQLLIDSPLYARLHKQEIAQS
ncbi:lipid A export permease/ATP-binding protein MsbA [Luminiphilus sp.]|nr:lipid A export permease/ATP-binding protein MsbA [Luminiphilus sp.]MDA8827462.1 lipid A export permease/ATP-binding protein MsbA [Luminiphilus sp.]MDB2376624.1 lipid A export permease/ATP-binding protein MsbA [Luminiphilus sp.]MDB3922548.1 lipid A export permease/ATP-binding protein MsbA [Luminiphilus sp.]